jgi:phage tail-like protein
MTNTFAPVTSKWSGAHVATDPLRNFKFVVTIHNTKLNFAANMGFMSASGLNVTTEVIPYREGGMNTTTQKMPGQSDFAPITLSKGLMVGKPQMINWMAQLFTVMQGTGDGGPGENFRSTVDIKILQHPVTNTANIPVQAAFRVYNAWPTSIAFSDLDAGANAITVTQMTLAHEGFAPSIATSITGSAPKFTA